MTRNFNRRIILAKIRWNILYYYEQFGILPCILSAIILLLSLYWTVSIRPEVSALKYSLAKIQRSLSVPLPDVKAAINQPHQAFSITEYQQVKALFAVLKKNGLQVNESHYQTQSNRDGRKSETLILEIPLSGDYPHLYSSLQEIKAALPVTIETITLSRDQPDSTALNILLRIALESAKS